MSDIIREAGPSYRKALVAAGAAVGAGVLAFAAYRRVVKGSSCGSTCVVAGDGQTTSDTAHPQQVSVYLFVRRWKSGISNS